MAHAIAHGREVDAGAAILDDMVLKGCMRCTRKRAYTEGMMWELH
jgi:hypothetical protein